jgi:hypothetical protein
MVLIAEFPELHFYFLILMEIDLKIMSITPTHQ